MGTSGTHLVEIGEVGNNRPSTKERAEETEKSPELLGNQTHLSSSEDKETGCEREPRACS